MQSECQMLSSVFSFECLQKCVLFILTYNLGYCYYSLHEFLNCCLYGFVIMCCLFNCLVKPKEIFQSSEPLHVCLSLTSSGPWFHVTVFAQLSTTMLFNIPSCASQLTFPTHSQILSQVPNYAATVKTCLFHQLLARFVWVYTMCVMLKTLIPSTLHVFSHFVAFIS